MNIINDKYVCGTRGGINFRDVQRPDAQTKECPSGTKPCSASTSPENTLCYPEADLANCPITGMTLNSAMAVTLSKNADSLPITSFKVEAKPCAKPDEQSKDEKAEYHPFENGDDNECTEDKMSKKTFDDRYAKLTTVNQFQLQKSSGVLDQIKDLPDYDAFFTPDIEASKKKV